ncbi:hypothetical protein [Methylobacterium brachythecii]|uniref:Uncharacterized protein n=1 Tax=Methylobacterium brachythecii TaxID=1176177 RepID=A0ABQ6DAA8_9HYPH|nr:hypothetical protein [Methylobacterium brachythecii]GLS46616.1 hypothetical protein GCM10007884_46100 [Methylobacterium brachythecii]
MRRTTLLVATLLLACPASASELSAGTPDCGGDAFSSVQVIEHRPPRRGPLTAVPDTLCADITPQQPPARIDIYANPIIAPQVGSGPGSAPYGTRQPLVGGPPQPRYP